MDRQALNFFNIIVLILVLVIVFFSWFYMREQFMWGIILIVLLVLIAGYVNVMRKMPWEEMSRFDVAVAVAALAILGFAWFYMREQFAWACNLVLLLMVIIFGVRAMKWLKDVSSIQVIVHKKEDGGADDPGKVDERK
jgi:uncharacterized protein (DUF486 family)